MRFYILILMIVFPLSQSYAEVENTFVQEPEKEEEGQQYSPNRQEVLEAMIQKLTSQIEIMNHKMETLEKKVDIQTESTNERFLSVEQKIANAQAAVSAPKNTKPVESVKNTVTNVNPETKTTPSETVVLQKQGNEIRFSNESQAFNHGLSLLKSKDYVGAQAAFQEFINQNPQSTLCADAYYWLGESLYMQRNFEKASIQFAHVYDKYRDSPKAYDSLFKLGMCFKELKKVDSACVIFKKLANELPNVSNNLKTAASMHGKDLKCSGM